MGEFHEYRSVWEHDELMRRLGRIRHVALDMDGTIYMGGSLFPWTKGFLAGLPSPGPKDSLPGSASWASATRS